MLQLAERLRLDLANAFARDRKLLADFFQCVVGIHADAKAHTQHALLARRERGENPRGGFAQIRLDRRIDGQDRVLVLDEIAEMAVFLIANGRLERDRLLGDFENLADLLKRHGEFFGQLFGRRLAADFMQHLARGANQLVDRLDHVNGDADGARLVGDRARDRLTNPPCRIGAEFVAAAIFEFIDRLHEADIAFLNEIEELQSAVGIFLGNGNHETKVRLHHFLLGDARLALALLHTRNDAAIFLNIETRLGSERLDFLTEILHLVALVLGEAGPALALEAADTANPVRVQFVAEILLQEFVARDAVALREAEKAAFHTHQTLVDRVKLLDKRFDAVVVEGEAFHFLDKIGGELLVFLVLRRGKLVALKRELDLLVLQLAQLLVIGGNGVEGFEHFRLQFGFHRGKRHGVVVLAILIDLFFLGLDAGRRLTGKRGLAVIDLLGIGTGKGGVEVDDVAKENLALVQLIAPDDDRLEGERAFAQARDHGFAAGLDALGDGDFALARQKFNRTHFAQIHADGIVGAVERGAGGRGGGDGLAGRGLVFIRLGLRIVIRLAIAAFRRLLRLVVLDDIDAHFGEHRERVFDLFGGKLLGRQNLVQLVIGHKPARLGGLDHFFDRRIRHVEQRPVLRCLRFHFGGLYLFRRLARHSHSLRLAGPGSPRKKRRAAPVQFH